MHTKTHTNSGIKNKFDQKWVDFGVKIFVKFGEKEPVCMHLKLMK